MASAIPTKKAFKSGEVIMRQGDPGESAYIIESGRVEILVTGRNGKVQNVGTRGPGTMIGEMALVDNAPRTATVQAVENCVLLEITKEDFSNRLQKADPILRMTSQVILTRYRDTLTRAEISNESSGWPPVEAQELTYAGQTDAIESVKIANDFRTALEKKQLALHYQPIIDLQKGKVSGFEALMRWNHPERGYISPGLFIPIAEQSGLIVDASRWALREACMALKRIESRAGFSNELSMSVNFSSTDFASEDFIDTIYTTISETDVDPNFVHLEITERLLMGQPDNAKDTLLMCRKAGIGISIDDFGTGYSSLSYLHYFPIDTLKIDQSFIRDMQKNESSMELVKSIIALGKNMKMHVIAEGVESKDEAKVLRDLGCDFAQGYYFAKPMSETDITKFVNEQGRKINV
ncbi:MAG TPA: EAL domain-containing protein [Alphaproteobacteria bacterium]|jgi:diguanylate cyclase|nr:EAL domain-containing protein [Micavibrio sp.]MBK9561768.1 EAL domain-containing protein [Micavibrio sp.]HQX26637.1 EAL domain-containing protein [Alphaproteobacteria bacterium]